MVRPKKTHITRKSAPDIVAGSVSGSAAVLDNKLTAEVNTNEINTTTSSKQRFNKQRKKISDSSKVIEDTDDEEKLTITPDFKEPRKRRMASLNAEFLVHYCSTHGNSNNEINHGESLKVNGKRPRTISSSTKQEDNHEVDEKTRKPSRIEKDEDDRKMAVKAKGRPRKVVASQLDSSRLTVNTRKSSIDPGSVKMTKRRKYSRKTEDEQDEDYEEKKNVSIKDQDEDLEQENDQDEDEEVEEKVKRKPEKKGTGRGRKSTATNTTKISNKRTSLGRTRGKTKEETDSENVDENSSEESEKSEDEEAKNTKNKFRPRIKKKISRRKPQPIDESDHDEEEKDNEEEESEAAVETRGRKRVTLSPQAATGRPKREASMRASAMIIQTNEIEKTRFQYYSTASATTPSITPQQIIKPENQQLSKNIKKQPGTSSSTTNDVNFQVPQTPITKSAKKTKNLSQSANLTSNLRHIPTVTTIANSSPQLGGTRANGDGSSSNDILIVAETTGNKSKQGSQKSSNSSNERPLTEDLLAEHNKICGTQTCGGGTFSNYTREYISKWAMDYIQPEEKPFPAETIPIETFGVKVLNEPQYLNHNKSRSSVGSNSTQKATKQTSSKTEPIVIQTTEPVTNVSQVTTKKQQAVIASNMNKDSNGNNIVTNNIINQNNNGNSPANQPKSTSTNATNNTNSNSNNNNNNDINHKIILKEKSLEQEANLKTINDESNEASEDNKVKAKSNLNDKASDENNDSYCNNNNNSDNNNKIHFLATKLVST